jgi:hypothetical protein
MQYSNLGSGPMITEGIQPCILHSHRGSYRNSRGLKSSEEMPDRKDDLADCDIISGSWCSLCSRHEYHAAHE